MRDNLIAYMLLSGFIGVGIASSCRGLNCYKIDSSSLIDKVTAEDLKKASIECIEDGSRCYLLSKDVMGKDQQNDLYKIR